MITSIDILKQFEDITYRKLKTCGFSDFETTYKHERELAKILSDSISGVIKPDEIYFEEQSIKTALKNWKTILKQWGIMPTSSTVCNKHTTDPKQFEHIITIPEYQLELIISRFYSLLDKIAEFNDRNKIPNTLLTYDTGSKYAAAGFMIVGVIGIVCCIIIGLFRTNNNQRNSTLHNVTLDEQYRECVKENECEVEASNN